MERKEEREVLDINIMLMCDHKCESCEKFFDCRDPMKERMYRRLRMSVAIRKMAGIKHKVAISGGKGGVGKSLVSVNIATALAMKGQRVTILDQDLDGASIPKMLGIQGKARLTYGRKGLIPATDELGLGMQIVSLSLVYPDEVISLFHEMRRGITEEFIAGVDYGERDWLIVDLPPGTSSDACNLLQYIPDIDGTVTVTLPSMISQLTARKATILAAKAGARVLGIVENMSGHVCECGERVDYQGRKGGETLAEELGVPLLGRIPLDEEASRACDEGIPVVYKYPDCRASKVIREIADKLESMLEKEKNIE